MIHEHLDFLNKTGKMYSMQIKVKDVVLHTPSGLYYICENTKHQKWMNDPLSLYVLAFVHDVPEGYFKNAAKR